MRDAEAGKPCPQLRVLAGNQLFIGTPGRAGVLLDAMEAEMQQSAWNQKQRNKELPRQTAEAQEQFQASYTSPLSAEMKHLVDALMAPETEPVLTLTNVQWWPMAGDGLSIPGIRIPFGAITAWWITGGQTIKARAGM